MDSHIWPCKAERPARTYIQQLCEDTGCNPEELPEAMNDREKWRERVRDIRAGGTTWWWWWWYNGIYLQQSFKKYFYWCIFCFSYVDNVFFVWKSANIINTFLKFLEKQEMQPNLKCVPLKWLLIPWSEITPAFIAIVTVVVLATAISAATSTAITAAAVWGLSFFYFSSFLFCFIFVFHLRTSNEYFV